MGGVPHLMLRQARPEEGERLREIADRG